MKSTILLAVISIFALVIFFNGRNLDQGYIKIEYTGDRSKPYPILIFYLPGSIDTAYENFFTHKFEITGLAFEEIRKSTESRKTSSKDTVLINPYQYQFTIFMNGETSVFLTPYLNRIRQVFQDIFKQLKDPNAQKKAKTQFDYIIIRLKADNKLN